MIRVEDSVPYDFSCLASWRECDCPHAFRILISSFPIQFLLATSSTITASHQYYLNVVQALFQAGEFFFLGGLVTINNVLSS